MTIDRRDEMVWQGEDEFTLEEAGTPLRDDLLKPVLVGALPGSPADLARQVRRSLAARTPRVEPPTEAYLADQARRAADTERRRRARLRAVKI